MNNELEFDYKGFMQDFRIADGFGESAIRDTYTRAFNEWKDDVEYFTSLVLTLNHLIWFHHDRGGIIFGKIYDELWKEADEYGLTHFKGDDLNYYLKTLD